MPKVVIIGAGMAGLAAADVLKSGPKKVNITIYEASGRMGGRAWTVKLRDEAMDWGCEALEAGPEAPTAALAAFGTAIPEPHYPKELYVIPQQGDETNIYKEVESADGEASVRMGKNVEAMKGFIREPTTDMPSDNVAYEVNVDHAFTRVSALMSGYGPFAESSYLGQSSAYDRARSEILQEKYSNDAPQFFEEGLGEIVRLWSVEKKLPELVKRNTPITLIENVAGNRVKVVPALKTHPAEEADEEADYVLVTVPTDVVSSGRLTINDLSGDQMWAFRDCPLGYYHKVVVTGYDNITKPARNGRFYVTGSPMQDLYFIAHSPGGKYCMAHCAGATAVICNLNPRLAENIMTNVLTKLNPHIGGNPTFYHSTWHTDEYIGGAYSYGTVNRRSARETLHRLKVGNIYFAGEACSLTWYGQLAGAMETGQQAAREILEQI